MQRTLVLVKPDGVQRGLVGAIVTRLERRGLKLMGLVAPPKTAGLIPRVRGIVLVILLVILVLALGFGIVKLISLPLGGISTDLNIFYGLVLVAIAIGALAYFGRKRQKRAQAERAEQIASRSR